jgi:glycosyltransferase involved in cell wall biosynthesis
MRLLFVTPFVPGENAGHAGAVTVFRFVEGLTQRGHAVHLVTLCREFERPLVPPLQRSLASVSTLRIPHRHDGSVLSRVRHFLRLAAAGAAGLILGRPVYLMRYHYPSLGRLLQELVERLQPDLVQLEYMQLIPLRRRVPPELPVLLDTHEVQSLVTLRSVLSSRGPMWHLHALDLAAWIQFQARLQGFARILTVSDRDRLALEAFAPGLPLQTLPHGVDCSVFRPRQEPREPDSLVFVGSFDHHQNLDAARLLLEQVLPAVQRRRPEVRLHLAGNHPPAWLQRRAGPSVVVPGFVEDLARYVGTRKVFVAPLRQGAGIKVKLLQALALGLPVVTTPEGAEGIGLQHGKDALIAPDAAGCAELCLRVLEDPSLAEALGKAGRALAQQRFNVPAMVERLEQIYQEILAAPRT